MNGAAGDPSPSASRGAATSVPIDAAGKPLTKKQIAAASVKAVTLLPSVLANNFTANEIKIGIGLIRIGDFGKQFRIDASYGHGEKQAAVDCVNAKRGVARRKVRPVAYTNDLSRAGTVSDGQFEAQACAKWTDDQRVFAAVSFMGRPSGFECPATRGVPAVHKAMPIDDQRLSHYHDYDYAGMGGQALTIDRSQEATVKVLGERGFYKPVGPGKPTVVGIMYYDDQFYRAVVDNQMVPMLKSFGVKKIVLQAAPRGETTRDASYVARFQQDGVTHIHFVGESNGYPLTFMPVTDSQLYGPKYGLCSHHATGVSGLSASLRWLRP